MENHCHTAVIRGPESIRYQISDAIDDIPKSQTCQSPQTPKAKPSQSLDKLSYFMAPSETLRDFDRSEDVLTQLPSFETRSKLSLLNCRLAGWCDAKTPKNDRGCPKYDNHS